MGISVVKYKYINVLIGGGICGIGGAFCSMVINGGVWMANSVNGLGWIAASLKWAFHLSWLLTSQLM